MGKRHDPVLDQSIGKMTTKLQENAEMTNGLEETITKRYNLDQIQTLGNVRGAADLIRLTLAIRDHDHLQDNIVNIYVPVLDRSICKITVLQENIVKRHYPVLDQPIRKITVLQENIVKRHDPVLDQSIGKITSVLQENTETTNGPQEMIAKCYHLRLVPGLLPNLNQSNGEMTIVLHYIIMNTHDPGLLDNQSNADMTNVRQDMIVVTHNPALLHNLNRSNVRGTADLM